MSWDDIDGASKSKEELEKIKKEKNAQALELAKKISRLFSSDDGKVVYQHLFEKFLLQNDTEESAQNIEFSAGVTQGEINVIKYITSQFNKAKTL